MLDQVGSFPRRGGSPHTNSMDRMDGVGAVAQASRSAFSAYYPGGPVPSLQETSAVPDSAFATIMSLPQPQPRPRTSPWIPRSVPPPPPKSKAFSLPNALSRVGTPVAKGTWILGREHEIDGDGYVQPVKPPGLTKSQADGSSLQRRPHSRRVQPLPGGRNRHPGQPTPASHPRVPAQGPQGGRPLHALRAHALPLGTSPPTQLWPC